jgi:hypothetical protein
MARPVFYVAIVATSAADDYDYVAFVVVTKMLRHQYTG